MQLTVKTGLPLGLAWNWVKFSFSIFRDRSINFLVFGLFFLFFSLLPFIGSFLGSLVIVRIYLSADKVANQERFGLSLNLLEIIKQRNIINFALFGMLLDLFMLSIFEYTLNYLQIDMSNPTLLTDTRVMTILLGLSLFRVIFIGIALAITTFNKEIPLYRALLINWQFIFKNLIVIFFAVFLLLPFLLIPVYISSLIAALFSNGFLFFISGLLLLVFILVFINVIVIFSYKLYMDGVTHE